MQNTQNYLESLPPWNSIQRWPEPWLQVCGKTILIAEADIVQLLKAAETQTGVCLLPDVVFEEKFWAEPASNLGSAMIVPARYSSQKNNPTALRPNPELNFDVLNRCPLEMEFEINRPVLVGKHCEGEVLDLGINMSLNVNWGSEFTAFREIYRDYRGIVVKLLNMGSFEFLMDEPIEAINKVRGTKPISKIDALLGLTFGEPDLLAFQLVYTWSSRGVHNEGVRAFTALAILFTCIQKAAETSRGRKDHILDYWRGVSVPPKSILTMRTKKLSPGNGDSFAT